MEVLSRFCFMQWRLLCTHRQQQFVVVVAFFLFSSRKINANILENYQEQNANCSEPIIFIPPCNGDIFRHFGHCATLMVWKYLWNRNPSMVGNSVFWRNNWRPGQYKHSEKTKNCLMLPCRGVDRPTTWHMKNSVVFFESSSGQGSDSFKFYGNSFVFFLPLLFSIESGQIPGRWLIFDPVCSAGQIGCQHSNSIRKRAGNQAPHSCSLQPVCETLFLSKQGSRTRAFFNWFNQSTTQCSSGRSCIKTR